MAHVRNQLLHWLKGTLTAAAGAVPITVRRVTPFPESMTGAIDIAISGEQSQDLTIKGAQQRIVRVRALVAARGDSEQSQDRLDELCTIVETTIAGDPSFGGLARQYEYRATEFVFSGNGDQPMSVAAMSFDVTVLTRRENPQAVA